MTARQGCFTSVLCVVPTDAIYFDGPVSAWNKQRKKNPFGVAIKVRTLLRTKEPCLSLCGSTQRSFDGLHLFWRVFPLYVRLALAGRVPLQCRRFDYLAATP